MSPETGKTTPGSQPHPNPLPELNREQAFQIYSLFAGDAEKTAAALGIEVCHVERVATQEGWADKLAAIIRLKKSGRPGDFERAINAALNFVQAHRLRMFLERQLQKFEAMTDAELASFLCKEVETIRKDGVRTVTRTNSTRSLTDYAAALEKAHSLTYLALHDTATDRKAREETQDGRDALGAIHQELADAMAKVRASTTPRALIFDAQLKLAQELRDAQQNNVPAASSDMPCGSSPRIQASE
jgi:hypothetical protein